jgi:IS5 family transposase
MPKKRSKKNPLAATDKARNRATSRERVPGENVIAMLKTLQDYRSPLQKSPPPFRPALLPHRRNLQHGAQSHMTVMQEV